MAPKTPPRSSAPPKVRPPAPVRKPTPELAPTQPKVRPPIPRLPFGDSGLVVPPKAPGVGAVAPPRAFAPPRLAADGQPLVPAASVSAELAKAAAQVAL
eukprot:2690971-Alexandrium_andersonii.AAC.1